MSGTNSNQPDGGRIRGGPTFLSAGAGKNAVSGQNRRWPLDFGSD
jgi:hypothetical protein